jgi:hypothetical protein
MDEGAGIGGLEAWGLATFHVTTLVAGAVLLLHRAGTLGALLAGLGTLQGAALFLLLWVPAVWATRQALLPLGPAPLANGPGPVFAAAGFWGGATGAFFVGIALGAALLAQGAPPVALVAVLFAAAFGFVGGAIVGMLAALLDLLLLAAVRNVGPPPNKET